MAPQALRFAREHGLFTASYQVLAAAVSGADTVRRMNRREIVRLEDFAETASSEERVFFQRFMTLPPGSYEISFTLRELSSRDQATRIFQVEVPPFGEPGGRITEPVVALRAVARQAYAQRPPLIISPRSTAAASREPPFLVVEVYDNVSDTLTLRVTDEGLLLWEQVLVPESPAGPEAAPRTVLTRLPVSRIPPGLAELTVATEDGITTNAPLLLALDDVWAFAEWHDVVEHLAYAIHSDSIDHWVEAELPDRASLWAAFWERTDLDPATPRNEFLGRYFDRMSRAEDQYGEPGIPGWRTDRGRSYVQLGRADREIIRGGGESGEPYQIEWHYDESLPFEVVLRYVELNNFGVFRLDQRSHLVLRDASRRLAERERSGEWIDERDTESDEDEGIG
jgi:GWxTD domain-containing protein